MNAEDRNGPEDGFSVLFDGRGGARPIRPGERPVPAPAGGFVWYHLRRDSPGTAERLAAQGLDGFVIDALTADETRPRCTVHGNGVFLNLRGVNLDPGAEPEDMISVRLWLESDRVVGVSRRPLHAISDLRGSIERGEAPVSVGDFVARLSLRLTDRAEPGVTALNERIDDLEELILDPGAEIPRARLSALRRSAIVLRRYFVPQRDALTTLEIEDLSWLGDRDRSRIREAAERVQRLGEDLDAIRDRAQIVQEQIMDQRAERMNRQMLLLSVVAAIFLPLGLLTGLLGINVGGMPGAEDPRAFLIVCIAVVVIGGALFLWFRRIGMFR